MEVVFLYKLHIVNYRLKGIVHFNNERVLSYLLHDTSLILNELEFGLRLEQFFLNDLHGIN